MKHGSLEYLKLQHPVRGQAPPDFPFFQYVAFAEHHEIVAPWREKDQRNEQKRGTNDKNQENCKPVRLCSLFTPTWSVVLDKHRQEYILLHRSSREIVHSARTCLPFQLRVKLIPKKMLLGRSAGFPAFLWLLAFTVVKCDLDLQMLHVVFRHGDKVPHREFQNYPTDPYRDYSYYPMGNGDLTNQGKLREYRIGTMLRERYDRYFGPDYWPEKIYAQSTDVPRTQLSLQLVLAGLFPPSEKQTWNPHLPWIPASTFFVPYDADNLLFPHYCPRYKEEYSKFLQQSNTRDILNKYKYVMNYLTEHTGKPINTTSAVTYLYNLFKEQAAQNLTLPQWTETVYPMPMKEILALDFKLRSYTKTLQRLNGGMLLRKMIEDVRAYMAGKLEPYDRKAFFFAAHEMNVAAVAKALGLDEPVIPAYGSTVILETLRDKKGTYYVRTLLWTGVTEQLIIQTIPGCTELCPFEQFLGIVKDVIPNDEEYRCQGNRNVEEVGYKDYIHSSASNVVAGRTTWTYLSSLMLLAIFSAYFVHC